MYVCKRQNGRADITRGTRISENFPFFFALRVSRSRVGQTSLLPARLLGELLFRRNSNYFFPSPRGIRTTNGIRRACSAEIKNKSADRSAFRDNEIYPGYLAALLISSVPRNRASSIAERTNREHRSLFLYLFSPRKNRNRYNFSRRHGSRADYFRVSTRGSRQFRRRDWNSSPPSRPLYDIKPRFDRKLTRGCRSRHQHRDLAERVSQQRGDLHYLLNSNMELIMITKLARGKHAKMATASLAATHTHARYQHACSQYGDARGCTREENYIR